MTAVVLVEFKKWGLWHFVIQSIIVLTKFIDLLSLGYMSKHAVLVLPFFIAIIIGAGPLITTGSGQKNTSKFLNNNLNSNQAVSSFEFLAQNYPELKISSEDETKKSETIEVLATAYSSSIDETDETPYITASGDYAMEGVAAANFLPFDAKIRLPEIFGDKIFVIKDRLREDYNDRIDIWFSTKEQAIKFGVKITKLEILY